MPLGQGDQVRLTTARYYTPTGRSIQRPYDTSSRTDYYAEVRKRHQTGEMNDPSKIPINDSLIFTTPKGKKFMEVVALLLTFMFPLRKQKMSCGTII